MSDCDEILSKIRAARVRYLNAVVRWRAVRDRADAELRAAEHELAQGLAGLFRDEPASAPMPVVSDAGAAQVRAPQH